MKRGYQGAIFLDDPPGATAGGRIVVDGTLVRFESDEAQAELPVHGLELKLGGAGNRLVFLSHPSVPERSIYTADHGVLQDPHLLADQDVAHQMSLIQGRKRLARVLMGIVAAVAVAALVGLYQAKDPVVEALASRLPPSAETRLGEVAFSQLKLGRSFVTEPELLGHFESLAAPLVKALPEHGYPFRFHIVRDASINAFALPGGNVVIHSGLLLEAGTPEEVLGVVAHEIAHVTRRHGVRQMISSLGLFALVQAFFGDVGGLVAVLAEGGAELLTLSFSRDFEREADDTGWLYLLEARINPQGLLTFFDRLRRQERPTTEALSLLSTHPATLERIRRLESKLHHLAPGTFRKQPPDALLALQAALRPGEAPPQGDRTDASQD